MQKFKKEDFKNTIKKRFTCIFMPHPGQGFVKESIQFCDWKSWKPLKRLNFDTTSVLNDGGLFMSSAVIKLSFKIWSCARW